MQILSFMKGLFQTLLVCTGVVMSIASCTKDPTDNLTAEESRLYITQKDSTANFTSYSTFFIPDSVSVVKGNQAVKELNNIDTAYINATARYMTAAGYTQTTDSSKADLGVNVNRIYNVYTGYYSYGGYWGGYGGYWDPGYYWGLGGYGYGYPGFVGTYYITDVSISINILDLKNAKTNKTINLLWLGSINGSGVANNNNPSIADSQVGKLFAQSTYLKK